MKNKVMIIGGAGFIGSHLVDVYLKQNYGVMVYDDFTTGKREYLPTHPLLQVSEESILDSVALVATLRQFEPDTVFHLAAIHYIPACENAPDSALRINIEGTQNVLMACAEQKIAKVVFASTGALYDPITTGPLAENSPVNAYDIYSISKLSAEQLLRYYTIKHKAKAVIVRLFNAVGRRETNPHIIPTVMTQLATGERQVRLGNLHPCRDYVHVEDIAEALFEVARYPTEQLLEIFNIGSGCEYSVQELMNLCSDVIGEPLEVISDPSRQRKTDRPSQLADLSKISQATGWKPSRNLKQALTEVWDETQSKY